MLSGGLTSLMSTKHTMSWSSVLAVKVVGSAPSGAATTGADKILRDASVCAWGHIAGCMMATQFQASQEARCYMFPDAGLRRCCHLLKKHTCKADIILIATASLL